MKNVSQRKAPGAMSAIALTVRPVRPSVALDVDGADSDGIRCSFSLRASQTAETAVGTGAVSGSRMKATLQRAENFPDTMSAACLQDRYQTTLGSCLNPLWTK